MTDTSGPGSGSSGPKRCLTSKRTRTSGSSRKWLSRSPASSAAVTPCRRPWDIWSPTCGLRKRSGVSGSSTCSILPSGCSTQRSTVRPRAFSRSLCPLRAVEIILAGSAILRVYLPRRWPVGPRGSGERPLGAPASRRHSRERAEGPAQFVWEGRREAGGTADGRKDRAGRPRNSPGWPRNSRGWPRNSPSWPRNSRGWPRNSRGIPPNSRGGLPHLSR